MQEKEKLNICVTGHRPERLPGKYDIFNKENSVISDNIYKELKNIINENIDKEITLINGLALGIDQMFAIVCINLKSEYPNILIESAIPCLNHSDKWPNINDKKRWQYIVDNSDIVTYVSQNVYTSYCMIKRNEYMVNKSDLVIAFWDGIEKGGTYNAINQAKKKNKKVINIFE